MEQAAAALAAGRRAEAARLFQSAADRYGSVQALLNLARIKSGEGNAPAAVGALARARVIAPNSEEVLLAFSQVSLAAGSPVPAVHALRSLTRMYAAVPEYHYQLGVALMLAGDMPAAIEVLERSEQLDPANALTLTALGIALNEQKRHGEAKPYLTRSVELTQGNVDALAALAEAEEGLGEAEPAGLHARRALEANSAHGRANFVMGLLAMRAQRYADARDSLLRALEGDPGNPRTHYQLSLAYARLGDSESARRQVELYQLRLRESRDRLRGLRGEGPGGRSPK